MPEISVQNEESFQFAVVLDFYIPLDNVTWDDMKQSVERHYNIATDNWNLLSQPRVRQGTVFKFIAPNMVRRVQAEPENRLKYQYRWTSKKATISITGENRRFKRAGNYVIFLNGRALLPEH